MFVWRCYRSKHLLWCWLILRKDKLSQSQQKGFVWRWILICLYFDVYLFIFFRWLQQIFIFPLNMDHKEKEKRPSDSSSQTHPYPICAYRLQKTAKTYDQSLKQFIIPHFHPKTQIHFPKSSQSCFLLPLPSLPIFPIIRIHRKPLLIAKAQPQLYNYFISRSKMGKFYVTIANNSLKYKVCK